MRALLLPLVFIVADLWVSVTLAFVGTTFALALVGLGAVTCGVERVSPRLREMSIHKLQ